MNWPTNFPVVSHVGIKKKETVRSYCGNFQSEFSSQEWFVGCGSAISFGHGFILSSCGLPHQYW